MNRSVSAPQQQVIRPVMSPMRQRNCSVSAEDTVLLRRKFEFQSPGVGAAAAAAASVVSVRTVGGEEEQGEELVSKKRVRQDQASSASAASVQDEYVDPSAPSGPWVPEEQRQSDDEASPPPSASSEDTLPLPGNMEHTISASLTTPSIESPSPRHRSTTSVASTTLQEISAMLTLKAQELAILAEQQVSTNGTPQFLNMNGSINGEAAGLREENERLRQKVAMLEARLQKQQRPAGVPGVECAKVLKRVKAEMVELKKMLLTERNRVLGMRDEWRNACRDAAGRIVDTVGRTEQLYTEAASERKKLLRRLQEVRGTIRVVARVRPLLKNEKGTRAAVTTKGDTLYLDRLNGQVSSFTFDAVLPVAATQADVYEELRDIPSLVLDGQNCCVLAYGQTGSGKTYTMLGDCGATASVLSDLYNQMKRREAVGEYKYRLFVSISEVYNDSIRDLFTHNKIDTFQGEYFGSEKEVVDAARDISDLLLTGERERACGESNFNLRSSRSHCAILARVEGVNNITATGVHGQVYLVDLAGSERIPSTSITLQGTSQTFISQGTLLKETQHINKSLSALGDVIASLSQSQGHIPYRNSRLTNLLKPCLRKGSKVLMIANISPAAEAVSETFCTLQFATRASSVHLNETRGAPRSPRPVISSPRYRVMHPSTSKQLRSRSAPNIWEC
eukprot:TRINITY_DN21976_c0_g1_i2.p1 TRINITY_DN21976_c0_g1~~TRINITY_DN21976_c0_g1_i2.p1  ORF type:complete len:678 (+),score=148.91 TRINITY_DN21976_c0_g1_i2:198-2231(+)